MGTGGGDQAGHDRLAAHMVSPDPAVEISPLTVHINGAGSPVINQRHGGRCR